MKELRELNDPEFDQYVKEISEGFCPYIAPSTKKDAIYFYKYELESNSIESIKKDIFYISLMHTELLRVIDSQLTKVGLYCYVGI